MTILNGLYAFVALAALQVALLTAIATLLVVGQWRKPRRPADLWGIFVCRECGRDALRVPGDPHMTLKDLIDTYTTDTSKVTADAATIAAATAAEATDTKAQTTDEATLAAALTASGPVAELSADGNSVNVFAPTASSPGFTVTNVPLASTVTAPTGSPPSN